MDESQCRPEPEQLVLRDAATAQLLKGLEMPAARRKKFSNDPLKLQFHLGPIGPRLREHAARSGTSMAALVRRATLRMLDEQVPTVGSAVAPPFEQSARNVRFRLYLPAACWQELTARTRAADMTRGEFVLSLLKGLSPPPLAADHKAAVQALRDSTDRLAAMSTDLGEFLRLLKRTTDTDESLAPYRESIGSLAAVVMEHMRAASVLIAELKPYRRARW
ncbi:hypothetical protein [Pelomonas cellulosilytica]|uniref:Ribbon-helix-helix protein CopG domain-containing protein n=1 Tax=Pelomonas cellulosilytica TaxID=2906762 RepID=A0ABS8XW01_9BURK|nr:hypothetical protein [Pelomonas sp. P8]MCE4555460.1 hypothetical protein [Pelomonas sp. P8]